MACVLAHMAATAHAQGCPPGQLFGDPALHPMQSPQRKVKAVDLNRDGVLDLVVSTTAGVEIRLARAVPGGLEYALTALYPSFLDPTNVAVADLDGDGILDLAIARDGGSIILMHGNGAAGVGDGTFTQIITYPTGSTWDIVATDVNGDAKLDLMFSTRTGLQLMLGTGHPETNGGFSPATNFSGLCTPKGIAVTDLDADGALDVLAAMETQAVRVYRGITGPSGPTGQFVLAQTLLVAGGQTFDVVVADLDRDGLLDVAAADYTGGSVTTFLQLPDHTFGPGNRHPVPGVVLGLEVGDFNQDGLPDLVAGAAGSAYTATLLMNDGGAGGGADHLGVALPIGPARTTFGLEVADLTGDGADDIAAAGLGDPLLAIFGSDCAAGRVPLVVTMVGLGQVRRDPDLLTYEPGTTVRLTAIPSVGYRFTHWSGDLSGSDNPTQIVLDRAKFVVANFVFEDHALLVSVVGLGTVTREPALARYPLGSTVRLTATPALSQRFLGWSGDAAGTDPVLDLLMDADKAVTATFAADPAVVPTFLSITDVLADQGGRVRLEWSASSFEKLAGTLPQHVDHYWLWRELPDDPFAARTAMGARVARTRAAGREYFWEWLASVPADGSPRYRLTVSTANDSTPFGNPFTSFLVQGRNADDTMWFESAPDSGYSVDNLAPPAPAALTAEPVAGATRLHWSASDAVDVTGYRLHRGTSADFVPDAGNAIAETGDTSYTDRVAGTAFYKLAALDRHGNLSRFAMASAIAPSFAIERLTPNPAPGGRMTITLTLADDSPASLELLDLMGRRVTSRSLAPGAGRQSVELGAGERLPAGLYWLRLRQGNLERTARAVVTE